MPGVTFFSLQKGYAAAQTASPPAGLELIDLTPSEIEDFADTAAHGCLTWTFVITTLHVGGASGRCDEENRPGRSAAAACARLALAARPRGQPVVSDDAPVPPAGMPGDWGGVVRENCFEALNALRQAGRDPNEI